MRSICVYASSSEIVGDEYRAAARELGIAIAHAGWRLVYGGAKIGLMGELARGAAGSGGKVTGVIPKFIADHGLAFEEAEEIIVTETIRERKETMEQRSDAFVALPGGFGTMEELFEIITLKQLHRHDKAISLLNVSGFFSPLVDLFEHLYSNGFANAEYRSLYDVSPTVSKTIDYLADYRPPILGAKWE